MEPAHLPQDARCKLSQLVHTASKFSSIKPLHLTFSSFLGQFNLHQCVCLCPDKTHALNYCSNHINGTFNSCLNFPCIFRKSNVFIFFFLYFFSPHAPLHVWSPSTPPCPSLFLLYSVFTLHLFLFYYSSLERWTNLVLKWLQFIFRLYRTQLNNTYNVPIVAFYRICLYMLMYICSLYCAQFFIYLYFDLPDQFFSYRSVAFYYILRLCHQEFGWDPDIW